MMRAGVYKQAVFRRVRATFSGGAFTVVAAESDNGITIGNLSTAQATVTFSPRPTRVAFLSAFSHDNAVDRIVAYPSSVYDALTGTMVLNFRAEDDGAADTPANGEVFDFNFVTDEG